MNDMMNFNDRKNKKRLQIGILIVVIILVAAMVIPMVLQYLL